MVQARAEPSSEAHYHEELCQRIYEKNICGSFRSQTVIHIQTLLFHFMKWVSEHVRPRDLTANSVVSTRPCASQTFISSAFHIAYFPMQLAHGNPISKPPASPI